LTKTFDEEFAFVCFPKTQHFRTFDQKLAFEGFVFQGIAPISAIFPIPEAEVDLQAFDRVARVQICHYAQVIPCENTGFSDISFLYLASPKRAYERIGLDGKRIRYSVEQKFALHDVYFYHMG
jgi:hypothetical protein